MRWMSDAYGKGIVRGRVEHTNVRAYAKDHDVTSAEAMSTCLTTSSYGREHVSLDQRLNDGDTQDDHAMGAEVAINATEKVPLRDVAVLYGQRPNQENIWLFISVLICF